MLTHQVIGPTSSGRFLVTYPTPGLSVPTVACDCTTRGQADDEAARLDREQLLRERAIRNDRQLRGLGGVYHTLDAMNELLPAPAASSCARRYAEVS